MNFINHTLKKELEEWRNRLAKLEKEQFGHQLKYFFDNINNNKQLLAIISEANHQYPYNTLNLEDLKKSIRERTKYDSLTHQAAFCYQLINSLLEEHTYEVIEWRIFGNEGKKIIFENYINPVIYYLEDKLNKFSSVLFLLEKYKRRVEWFTKKELNEKYMSAEKNYEQIFEDDLRLFLFDQGIEHPFSTPSSASGRADIIGEINTNDPLIVEIKIFDSIKTYGKNRIKDGFTQITNYANDYNKNVGYLVIFNMDDAEINFKMSNINNLSFSQSIIFNNKTFYFIVVNCSIAESASKKGTLKQIEITEEELTNKQLV